MGKNLILCADGTGNKGGSTPDSNVFKMFKAIDIHNSNNPKKTQLTFYDNGVGTSGNKFSEIFGGGLGVGFKTNVCDLYKFLARNYHDGDRVYLFGFSRGAATIRALTGFIGCCGLINGRDFDQDTLDTETKQLFKEYIKAKNGKTSLTDNWPQGNQGAIPIEFVGVWDTVSALGFPQGTDVLGPASWLINTTFNILSYLSNLAVPHLFYQYQLFDNIKHAYHAVAIDDERTAFQPIIWDETGRPEESVEQVWFSGMHSNVGGGYERDGLAYIPLYWMMAKAKAHGLIFKDGYLEEAFDSSNASGHIYNSRNGLGIFYRYHPREIERLCKGKIANIKIHQSVLKRMSRKTDDYAPGNLPAEFSVSQLSPPPGKVETNRTLQPGSNQDWSSIREKVDSTVFWRKESYMLLLISTITIVVFAICFWMKSVECSVQIESANDSNPQQTIIEKFFKSSHSKCTTLMINSADTPTKIFVVAGADNNDHGALFDNILIKQFGNELSLELNNEPNIDHKFVAGLLKHTADGLTYVLPRIFDNLIQVAVIKQPWYFIGTLIFGVMLWNFVSYQRKRKHRAAVELRKIVVDEYQR